MPTARSAKQWLKILTLSLLLVVLMSFWRYTETTDDELRAAIFRYQMTKQPGPYFLSIGWPGPQGQDPSDELLRKLQDFNPPPKRVSESKSNGNFQWRDKKTNEYRHCIYVNSIRQISQLQIEVDGGERVDDTVFIGSTFTLQFRGLRWVVTNVNTSSLTS